MIDYKKEALELHKKLKGKLEIVSKSPIKDTKELSLIYSPGVAEPCLEIAKDENLAYEYTAKGNQICILSDGSAVLGLGNIGATAGIPVMEGKSVLLKHFGKVNAYPLVVKTQNPDEIINIAYNLEPNFGAIMLEDIKSPECFYVEKRLSELCKVPVFHDDQHGTAIVALAGAINMSKITGKKISDMKIVLNGVGAAGTAIIKLLLSYGAKNIIACGREGVIEKNSAHPHYEELLKITNPNKEKGTLKNVLKNTDLFIGVSAPNALTKEDVKTMAKDCGIFAMANPIPEIMPDEAIAGGARFTATGRSDFKNQINNVLAFPGLFRGLLDVGAIKVSDSMKIKAAETLAYLVSDEDLKQDIIIPSPFDLRAPYAVAMAVAQQAIDENLARIVLSPSELELKIKNNLK